MKNLYLEDFLQDFLLIMQSILLSIYWKLIKKKNWFYVIINCLNINCLLNMYICICLHSELVGSVWWFLLLFKREASRCICQAVNNAMTPCVSSWIIEGLGPGRWFAVEGSYIGCTKCSGFLGFRDETTNAEANTTPNNCYRHFRRVKRHCQK